MSQQKLRSAERANSWHWAKGTYLAGFEENLARTAAALEAQGLPKLRSEYCAQPKHAQLLANDQSVAARVQITGECCMATTADVTLVNLPASVEDIFRYNLWPLSVRFTHVSYLCGNDK